ncbi:MAG TPA: response regulator transcription factor [Dehalococcoidia bacterium]|nr:response regulator transcription factor [Dehalococcoidia bacterium]
MLDVASRDDLSTLGEIAATLQVPTIAVSPDASREAVVELLRAGADLVLAKPFTLDALDAHVEALLRRTEGAGPGRFRGRYAYSDLVVDFAAHTVTLAGERLRLSATQYRILECLCRNAGAVVTATQLSDAVWGPDYNASSVLIRSHIRNLRRLLGDSAANPRYIHTETQIGYWVPKGDEET